MTFNIRDAIISEMIEAEMHRDTGRYQSLLEAMFSWHLPNMHPKQVRKTMSIRVWGLSDFTNVPEELLFDWYKWFRSRYAAQR